MGRRRPGRGWLAMHEQDHRPEVRFGEELRLLRRQANLTVRQLAKRLHRSHSSIVEYEGGVRLAPVEAVRQYEQLFGLQTGSLVTARESARLEREELDAPPETDHEGGACPYKGLEAFQYDDAALFFGREARVEEVLTHLTTTRFLAVIGPSGSGKSSFVRAGLLAGIRAASPSGDGGLPIAVLTPGSDPVGELARRVNEAVGDAARVRAADLRSDPQHLARATRSAGARGLVIVVDQLEELFTQCPRKADRRCFVDALMAAWRGPSSPVTVITAMRADFYGHLVEHPELAAAVRRHQELLAPMSRGDLQRAIERPAEICRLRLQAGLAQTMLDDLADQPGALPLLSHALLETWKHREVTTLTVRGYRDAGGVRGAIAQTAETTYQGLSTGDQAIARSILLRLTGIGEGSATTRRRVDRSELAGSRTATDALERVLRVLSDARLVTIEKDTVVVAHEALIRHWKRLQGWIDADRDALLVQRRLADAAREWEVLQRDPSALYRGSRLAAAREWAAEHGEDLGALEREFLAAGQASSQRSTRRLRILAAVLGALTVIVATLALLALDQRDSSQHEAANATSLALAMFSGDALTSRPDVALALALEAYREVARPEASSAVFRALQAAPASGLRGVLSDRGSLFDVAFDPDGKILASAGADDGTIQLWNPSNRTLLARLKGGGGSVVDLAFSPRGDTLAAASDDGTIALWNPVTRARVGLLRPPGGPIILSAVAFSRDGTTLAAAGDDGTLPVWNVATRTMIDRPAAHLGAVTGVAFSPDGKTLASSGDDGVIRLWDARTRKPRGELTGHTNGVTAIAFRPDGKALASAGADDTVRVWDLATRTTSAVLTGHTDSVYCVAFSPDGRTLASGGADNAVRLWNPATGARLARLAGHTDAVTAVAFSPDGATLASAGGQDGTIRLWNPAVRTHVTRLTGHGGAVNGVSFDPRNATLLASAGDDTSVRLWDPLTGARLADLRDHTSKVSAVAFTPDGTLLASAGDDGTIGLVKPATRRMLARLKVGRGPLYAVAFSADATTLAAGGARPEIELWNPASRSEVGRLRGHTGAVNGVAFSPDDRTLASASADRTVRLWDLATRRQRRRLIGHGAAVDAVAFSPDGRTLASAGEDRSIRLWNPASGAQLRRLSGHTGAVNAVAFSPDSKTLASAGEDGTVRLWNAATGASIAVLTGHPDSVLGVAFSPDGKLLASAGDGGTIRLWKVVVWRSAARLHDTVCATILTGLTLAEWNRYAPGTSYRRSCDVTDPR